MVSRSTRHTQPADGRAPDRSVTNSTTRATGTCWKTSRHTTQDRRLGPLGDGREGHTCRGWGRGDSPASTAVLVQPVLGDGDHRRGDIPHLTAHHADPHSGLQPGATSSATRGNVVDDLVGVVDQLQREPLCAWLFTWLAAGSYDAATEAMGSALGRRSMVVSRSSASSVPAAASARRSPPAARRSRPPTRPPGQSASLPPPSTSQSPGPERQPARGVFHATARPDPTHEDHRRSTADADNRPQPT